MKLTSKGRYAVMALVDLARFDNINPVSLRDISLRQGISLDYLEQIFSKLKKDQIVKSIRGTQGGYVLSKKPNEIKLTNIFHAVDEKVKTVQCKKESKKGCNGKATKCVTHNLWDELETHINTFFEKKSLMSGLCRWGGSSESLVVGSKSTQHKFIRANGESCANY